MSKHEFCWRRIQTLMAENDQLRLKLHRTQTAANDQRARAETWKQRALAKRRATVR